jgi:Outer membrane lipoprotein-sorting protein
MNQALGARTAIVIAISLLMMSEQAYAAPATGLEVMQRVQDRDVGKDSRSAVILGLVPKSGEEKVRKLLLVTKDYGKDSKSLVKFVDPKQLKNTGLLIHSFADSENLQWLYLSQAGKKEPRKIPASDKDDSFFGSEFYFVDFEEVQAADFDHTLRGNEEVNGYSTVIVESVPKEADYPYSKTISWVDTATDVPVKVDIYQNGELLKTVTVQKMEKRSDIDTPLETVVVNHQNGKKSYLRVEQIQYNTDIADDFFTLQQLVRDL